MPCYDMFWRPYSGAEQFLAAAVRAGMHDDRQGGFQVMLWPGLARIAFLLQVAVGVGEQAEAGGRDGDAEHDDERRPSGRLGRDQGEVVEG